MKERMNSIDVFTEGKEIYIECGSIINGYNEVSCISIVPEQVDLLVKWLLAAQKELLEVQQEEE